MVCDKKCMNVSSSFEPLSGSKDVPGGRRMAKPLLTKTCAPNGLKRLCLANGFGLNKVIVFKTKLKSHPQNKLCRDKFDSLN